MGSGPRHDHRPAHLAIAQELAGCLGDLADIEASADRRDRHMQDERCPNNEGEGVMYEVGDKHACLHGLLQPRNMGLPPMAHGLPVRLSCRLRNGSCRVLGVGKVQ